MLEGIRFLMNCSDIEKVVLGENHVDTLTTKNNIALCLKILEGKRFR